MEGRLSSVCLCHHFFTSLQGTRTNYLYLLLDAEDETYRRRKDENKTIKSVKISVGGFSLCDKGEIAMASASMTLRKSASSIKRLPALRIFLEMFYNGDTNPLDRPPKTEVLSPPDCDRVMLCETRERSCI